MSLSMAAVQCSPSSLTSLHHQNDLIVNTWDNVLCSIFICSLYDTLFDSLLPGHFRQGFGSLRTFTGVDGFGSFVVVIVIVQVILSPPFSPCGFRSLFPSKIFSLTKAKSLRIFGLFMTLLLSSKMKKSCHLHIFYLVTWKFKVFQFV